MLLLRGCAAAFLALSISPRTDAGAIVVRCGQSTCYEQENRLIQRRGPGYALSRDLNPNLVPVGGCRPLGHKTTSAHLGQVRKLAASLDRFGFVLPILIDPRGGSAAGWGLVLADGRRLRALATRPL
jgi:hypothetical protein